MSIVVRLNYPTRGLMAFWFLSITFLGATQGHQNLELCKVLPWNFTIMWAQILLFKFKMQNESKQGTRQKRDTEEVQKRQDASTIWISCSLKGSLSVQVIVTNTIPIHPDRTFPQLTVLSVASLLGETIWRMYNSSAVQPLLWQHLREAINWKSCMRPKIW